MVKQSLLSMTMRTHFQAVLLSGDCDVSGSNAWMSCFANAATKERTRSSGLLAALSDVAVKAAANQRKSLCQRIPGSGTNDNFFRELTSAARRRAAAPHPRMRPPAARARRVPAIRRERKEPPAKRDRADARAPP